ncbi:MAG: HRDC domain-containing protein [Candidatus Woesearchaeota archaeon]|nr:HRDC domain-containing protein [Candidatus Woesearchaeota archaeon]
MSRAKKSLYLTYGAKKPTSFITPKMLELLQVKQVVEELEETQNSEMPAVSQQTTQARLNSHPNDIIERLKAWRRDLARQTGMPAYIILHDRTIIDLVQQMPTTREELENITGLGPIKIVKYGDELLRIVGGG